MDVLYRPTPVRSLFRVVQCCRLRSSPLTPSPGFNTWRCTRVGPDASHSSFHAAAIHASLERSPGMTHLLSFPVVTLAGLESAWRHFIRCGVEQDVPVVFHCFRPNAGRGYSCLSQCFRHLISLFANVLLLFPQRAISIYISMLILLKSHKHKLYSVCKS